MAGKENGKEGEGREAVVKWRRHWPATSLAGSGQLEARSPAVGGMTKQGKRKWVGAIL